MEYKFNVNDILREEITLIDNRGIPQHHAYNSSDAKKNLCQIIDQMGMASAKAQGLHGAITASHLLSSTDHNLFIMKDASANNGLGAVVGFIKTGHKKLFIYDNNGMQHEMDPLCVLDFYVHESRQRMGCGKKLFVHMIQNENISVRHLAIDRPSHKFLQFLKKHYGMKATINQMNNFVVFDGFFRDSPFYTKRKRGMGKPPVHPYNQQASRVTSGSPSNATKSRNINGGPNNAVPLPQLEKEFCYTSDSDVDTPVLNRRMASLRLRAWGGEEENQSTIQNRKQALSNVSISRLPTYNNDRPVSGHRGNSHAERPGSGKVASPLGDAPNTRNMGAHHSSYSRHGAQTHQTGSIENVEKLTGTLETTSRPGMTIRDDDPPMFRRDGPQQDLKSALADYANPRNYQDSKGRLKLEKGSPSHSNSDPSKDRSPQKGDQFAAYPDLPNHDQYASKSAYPRDTGWNLFGVGQSPPGSRSQSAVPKSYSKKFQQTRLW